MNDRFQRAIEAFDKLNAEDPTTEGSRPRELVHAERLSRWVDQLAPNASEALRLAARCQHICRWKIPRSQYPEGRTGYLKWRSELAKFHADTAAGVLEGLGYDAETIEAVRRINLKRGLSTRGDSSCGDTQTIEDALCLSFLEFELEDFAAKHPEEKVTDILRKTWRKMSANGRERALQLQLSARVRELVQKALSA